MVSQETQESQAKDSQANGRALESKGNPSHQQNGKQEALTERELEERLVKTIEPPDGGWGWMIVFCSFGLHVILDGITYSFGVIFVALLEDFQGGKGDTAWILSIFVGVTLGTGPLASALVNRYSCRTVSIVGAVIGAVGFIISPFAPAMWYLYISFGVIGGIGFGLVYLPAIVIVSYYFERRRALATGLACCGSGFGTFIFAPLSAYFIEEFGWKHTCFLLAGIILQCCVLGALLRPLPLVDNTETLEAVNQTQQNGKLSGETQGDKPKPSGSHVRSKVSLNIASISSLNTQHVTGHQLKQHIPLHRKDVFYSGSLHNIPLYTQNKADYITSNMSLVHSLHQVKTPQTNTKQPATCFERFTHSFKSFIDFSLLTDWGFLLFLISNIFTNLGFNAPYIFIPDRAIEYGIKPKAAAFLLSILGIANTIGRIVFGYLADTSYIKPQRLHLYSTGLVLTGLCTAFSSFESHKAQIAYAALFGFFIGGYVSLTAIVLVDLLGVDKLTSSFGLTLLVQGVFVLIGPPIAGWLYDATASYTWSFASIGGSIAISGFMLYFLPLLSRLQHKRITKHDTDMGVRIGVQSKQEIEDEEVNFKDSSAKESDNKS